MYLYCNAKFVYVYRSKDLLDHAINMENLPGLWVNHLTQLADFVIERHHQDPTQGTIVKDRMRRKSGIVDVNQAVNQIKTYYQLNYVPVL